MFDWLVELFNKFGAGLMEIIPHSPFQQYIKLISVSEYIGYINWFIPVHAILIIINTWLVAIGVYYSYMIIARWIKLLD